MKKKKEVRRRASQSGGSSKIEIRATISAAGVLLWRSWRSLAGKNPEGIFFLVGHLPVGKGDHRQCSARTSRALQGSKLSSSPSVIQAEK